MKAERVVSTMSFVDEDIELPDFDGDFSIPVGGSTAAADTAPPPDSFLSIEVTCTHMFSAFNRDRQDISPPKEPARGPARGVTRGRGHVQPASRKNHVLDAEVGTQGAALPWNGDCRPTQWAVCHRPPPCPS